MPQKKSFPLRVNGEILDAMKRWSADELRSVNAQIEWVLRDALRRSGRLPRPGRDREDEGGE